MQARQNPLLKPFWLTFAHYKVLLGGRMSSKTYDAAGMAIFLADNFRAPTGLPLRILCARQFQNKISESVYATIKQRIYQMGLQHRFKINNNKIINLHTGAEFLFYGLHRSMGEIRGLDNITICWLEEAHALTKEQWEELEPTITRNMGYQFWFIFNPQLITDFIYEQFVLKPDWTDIGDGIKFDSGRSFLMRHINFDENPFLADDAKIAINRVRLENDEDYNHIYLGQPRDNEEQALIKRSWLTAAIDAHIKLGIDPKGFRKLGYDVGENRDPCAAVGIDGSLIDYCDVWKTKPELMMQDAKKILGLALSGNYKKITWDAISVGAYLGSNLREQQAAIIEKLQSQEQDTSKIQSIQFEGWKSGVGVQNPESIFQPGVTNEQYFENAKAQAWWDVRRRFMNTYNAVNKGMQYNVRDMLFIDSKTKNIDKMITELSTPYAIYSERGKNMVEPKKDLLKRGIESHNIADAVIMAALRAQTWG